MGRRLAAVVVLLAFLVVAVIDLYAEAIRWIPATTVARWVLMPLLALFLLLAAPRAPRSGMLGWTVAGLLFSGLGDVAPSLLIKFGLFLVAQVCYAVAFWPYRRRSLLTRPGALLLYLVLLGGLIGWVALRADDYRGPVIAYGVSLAVMGILAFGVNRTTALGAVLFVVSDIVLAVRYFVDPDLIPLSYLVNMGLYLPAQLLLTVGVLRRLRRSR